jgi:hypothetical protein
MFQLKLNDIELVSKSEYYRKYIIAITRMLKTEGCAPSVAQRENQHSQPHRPRTDDPDRFGPDYRIKFVRSFSYLLHGGSLPSLRLLSRVDLWEGVADFRRERALRGPRSSAAINSASIAACHSSACRVLPGNAMM